MKNFYNSVLCSSRELKNVRNLVTASLLITIKLILDLFTIQISPVLHLSFEFLASSTIGMLFGPVGGAVCGGLSDIINYIINPKGVFFPGFTISAMVLGMIYGTLLYKKKVTFIRCIIAEILVVLIVDIILNTFFLSLLYGKAFALLLPARAFKNVVMIPINASMMYFILKLVNRIKEQNF
ncbi:folate family ECF transporter S component [Clostridium saccharobutylicum]|uniref:Folate transporter FolT n=2 Tax=Clostridium saccharobutylicum TaxID=169679 RepID=U5MZ68_CLOSA|nr:folate family ECF transporter S component [Clostridium saccharobutylicum]AGX44822.1 folate transporter FolT [Clostridium saccharobutylicum DSM 13864]AQR92106.1 folate transporter FolT [Clostridium saccharobutylicum]AQS02008.1 folate transporter FolT [Clostridium saccharobutylicum]AQS11611.1 folate transporter FolT [Clostridium saccharobutylicum]AQS15991.1 folate transporter FolT [Clostridium saccharobutylicum]